MEKSEIMWIGSGKGYYGTTGSIKLRTELKCLGIRLMLTPGDTKNEFWIMHLQKDNCAKNVLNSSGTSSNRFTCYKPTF